MKFMCPDCGRTEIIIGDSSPDCRMCRVPMIKATMDYTNLMMSPKFVLERFRKVVGKH